MRTSYLLLLLIKSEINQIDIRRYLKNIMERLFIKEAKKEEKNV